MFTLLISCFTFICGILYLIMGYETAVGWVQVLLGSLCLFLTINWLRIVRKEKNTKPGGESAD